MLPTSPPPTPPDPRPPLPYRSSLGFMDLSEKAAFTLLGLVLLRDLKMGKSMSALLLSLMWATEPLQPLPGTSSFPLEWLRR